MAHGPIDLPGVGGPKKQTKKKYIYLYLFIFIFIFKFLHLYIHIYTVNFVLKQRSFNCLRNYLLLWHRVTVTVYMYIYMKNEGL